MLENPSRDRRVSLRLEAIEFEILEKVSTELGIAPTTFAHMAAMGLANRYLLTGELNHNPGAE
jgi:hypothetical protein